jgi:glycosyltransferase involved in cell wall biosynthesis
MVVDGSSDDGTQQIVRTFTRRDSRIQLIENPRRITPAALNLGIRRSKGDVIIRMDAHCLYPANYIPRLVSWLETSGADNVGGACRTRPSGSSAMARAIAAALAHPMGVGNSYFRLGVQEARWVDTVPFGCYRREVFERIGLFDEDLVRNQDDEFNSRLLRAGGRILLVPDVTSEYFARASLGKLIRTYWQYGLFKPLVARRVGRIATLRQLIPALFVSSLVLGAIAAAASPVGLWGLLLMIALYSLAVVASASMIARTHGVPVGVASCAVFPSLHLAYGAGFLTGVVRFRQSRIRRESIEALPLSR